MSLRPAAATVLLAGLASCAPVPPVAAPVEATAARPLDTLPAGADLALVRQDLLATAATPFGAKALDEALASPAFLIAKRFAGMPPPPPPGAGPDWRPPTPTALLVKRPEGWMVATAAGWRPANGDAAVELDQVLADPRFWKEPAYIPPCPDYGASLLLLKVPGKAQTVRNSACTSVAEKAVLAALRA